MIITYSAIAQDGAVIKRKGEFSHIHELIESLIANRFILLEYHKEGFFNKEKLYDFFSPKIKRGDIIEFCESLSSMIAGGLPLLDSVETLKETTKAKGLKRILDDILSDIAGGESFSAALSAHPKAFPDIMIFLCHIGEETGNLQGALKDTAYHLKRVDDIISNTKRALIYPTFVFVSMTGVLFFWVFYVLPKLVKVFSDMDIELPTPTAIMMKSVEILRGYWYVLPTILVLAMVIFIIMRKYETTKLYLDHTSFRIPLIGKVIKTSSLAIFFAYMSMMLSAGVTLTRSFEVMEKTFKNLALRNIVSRINRMASSGYSLFEACQSTKFFDLFALQMIKVGESTGNLDERLRYLADTYQEKVGRLVEVVGKMLEPIALGIAGGLFIIIVISLIGPVYDLITKIGG
ncbi:MAG: type II secretion system F family protein [Deltaproteobacteria bacterium]|nr:type II secretion system F family protein [Deltaproteobacteria bacterium]